ncbi:MULTISPECIES: DUF1453 domain-containing protein [unclassified Streptomyces]|uniref:DUF1453 domain-containing protein n=1 Tax=Streptomyces sp. R35 TaxID=3238630 RepID=A0AB39SHY9_9ACTN|nr:DUF1453 domain-containing protein [Streptomyces sp. NBC_01236]
MSGLVNALVICAVVVLVIARQFRTRRIGTDRRWWIVPAVLVVVALREPGLIDPHHHAEAILLLGAEVFIGLATGAGWAWTTRIWTAPDGSVWSKSTKASVAVWIVGIGLRVGLFGIGALFGVHQDSSALLLALAATLLVRSGLLVWRTQSLLPANGQSPAYGDGLPQALWKERV